MTAPNVGGGFAWDARAKQYRAPNGQFVSRAEIRRVLQQTVSQRSQRMTALSDQLRAGEVSGETWYVEMRQLVKDVHLYNAAAAKGGWAQLGPQDYGRVGRLVREQYKYLNRLADQISKGLPLDGRFIQRAKLYAKAASRTFWALFTTVMREADATEEHNVLGFAEHCADCLGETARGWVPLGELVPVGARACLGNCECYIEYR